MRLRHQQRGILGIGDELVEGRTEDERGGQRRRKHPAHRLVKSGSQYRLLRKVGPAEYALREGGCCVVAAAVGLCAWAICDSWPVETSAMTAAGARRDGSGGITG